MRGGSIRHAVIVFPGALGDLLLATPALRALRGQLDGAHVMLVVAGPLRALAANLAVGDTVADLDDARSARLFTGDEPPPWLADRPVLYSFLGAGDDALRARLAAWTTSATFLHVERGPDGPHATTAYARALGVAPAAAHFTPPRSSAADDRCRELVRPLLAMHRGAGSPAKRWSADGFKTVASWWSERGGAVLDVVGPAEHDATALDGAVVVRDWPLLDLAALLTRVDAYVGNDSGVSHLAGAVGAPGAVVFVSTPARRWHPAGRLAAIESPAQSRDVVDALRRPPNP